MIYEQKKCNAAHPKASILTEAPIEAIVDAPFCVPPLVPLIR
jgi:hypothetical protein